MFNTVSNNETTVKLYLQNHDVSEAIDWFCTTFGFDQFTLSSSAAGATAHDVAAQGKTAAVAAPDSALKAGKNLLVRCSSAKGEANRLVVFEMEPESGSANDPNFHGVEIKISDDAFGGRLFTCYDLEGQVWNFGIYNP